MLHGTASPLRPVEPAWQLAPTARQHGESKALPEVRGSCLRAHAYFCGCCLCVHVHLCQCCYGTRSALGAAGVCWYVHVCMHAVSWWWCCQGAGAGMCRHVFICIHTQSNLRQAGNRWQHSFWGSLLLSRASHLAGCIKCAPASACRSSSLRWCDRVFLSWKQADLACCS